MSCLAAAAFASPALAAGSASSGPNVHVPSALVMTMDGTVLWSHRPDAPRRVASTIKMLNALVVMDHANLDDVVVVPKQAASISNGAVGLVRGQKLTVRQLLNIMLVHSANDAAEALAIHVGGSEKNFVAMMNAKAKQLGLKHTHAMDPHGLGKHETSTANDLSVLARHIMADPTLRGIVRRTHVPVPRPHGGSTIYGTTDALLGVYRGMEGVKTGYTDPAGYVFVGACKRGNVELLGVIMGASSNMGRFTEMEKLLNWGFANHTHTPPPQVVRLDGPMGVVYVAEGLEPTVAVHAVDTQKSRLEFVGSKVATSVQLPQTVRAPVTCGQQLGTFCVTRDGAVIATVALVADKNVAAPPPPDPAALRLARAPRPKPSLWRRALVEWAAIWHQLLSGIARSGPAA